MSRRADCSTAAELKRSAFEGPEAESSVALNLSILDLTENWKAFHRIGQNPLKIELRGYDFGTNWRPGREHMVTQTLNGCGLKD